MKTKGIFLIFSILLTTFMMSMTSCEKDEFTYEDTYSPSSGIGNLNVQVSINKGVYKPGENIITSVSFADSKKTADVYISIYNKDGSFRGKCCFYSKMPGTPPILVGSYPTAPAYSGEYYVVFSVKFYQSITKKDASFSNDYETIFRVVE